MFDQGKHRVEEKEIVNYSFGLSLLDYGWYDTVAVRRMLNAVSDYCMKDYSYEYEIKHTDSEIPKYVEALMHCRDSRENNWIEWEFKKEIGNIGGIMIVDLSK